MPTAVRSMWLSSRCPVAPLATIPPTLSAAAMSPSTGKPSTQPTVGPRPTAGLKDGSATRLPMAILPIHPWRSTAMAISASSMKTMASTSVWAVSPPRCTTSSIATSVFRTSPEDGISTVPPSRAVSIAHIAKSPQSAVGCGDCFTHRRGVLSDQSQPVDGCAREPDRVGWGSGQDKMTNNELF